MTGGLPLFSAILDDIDVVASIIDMLLQMAWLSFPPKLSDFSRSLFVSGQHILSWNRLGFHIRGTDPTGMAEAQVLSKEGN